MILHIPKINSYLNITKDWFPEILENKFNQKIIKLFSSFDTSSNISKIVFPFGTGFKVIKILINQNKSIIQLEVISLLNKNNTDFPKLIGKTFEVDVAQLQSTSGQWFTSSNTSY